MRISIITVFEELYTPFLQTSLIRRAQDSGVVQYGVHSFREFCAPKERIDAPIFGHGAGMLLRPEVVERAIDAQEQEYGNAFKIFFSPQGKPLDQDDLKKFATKLQQHKHVMFVAARYEGMDARVENVYADALVSVGDFVLMGGDIPAMMVLEGMLRHIPGIVGRQESVVEDSFTGPFLDYPEFTEPVTWKGQDVPEVIRSGNHGQLRAWRMAEAISKTVRERFDWVQSVPVSSEQSKQISNKIPPHYVVLMHDQVMVGGSEPIEGTISVTSLDIHDIARSAKTYGLKNYFLVTPLVDQQKIVQKLLDFWLRGVGIDYNPHRHESLKPVRLQASLDEVISSIKESEGQEPLIVATSARAYDSKVVMPEKVITYHDQAKVWRSQRPILFVLGTGQGLSQKLIAQCDFVLIPLQGFSEFNHLSVRSAAAIIFDRWLGSNSKKIRR